ncbi:MAG: glycosyltransferase family 39 protein [Litorilinea sp.]
MVANRYTKHGKWIAAPAIWVGFLVAFALRLFHLGQESLWYDELVSVDLASTSLAHLIAQTARDIHPPGYYLLLAGWTQLADPVVELGQSFEYLYGFPSAALGLLVCALTYAIAKRYLGPRVALLALWLTALHPFQITYSQEVRMYTLGATLCLLYFLLTDSVLRPRPLRAVMCSSPRAHIFALGITAAAGLYTFYYFGFLMVVAGIAVAILIVQQKRHASRPINPPASVHAVWHWIAAHGIAFVLWLPWLPIFIRQAIDPPVPPWRTEWNGLAETLSALYAWGRAYTGGHVLDEPSWYAALLFGGVLILSLLGYAKHKTHNQRTQTASQSSRPSAFFETVPPTPLVALTIFALGPPALLILLSATLTPLFHVRYLYVFQAPFLILLAFALLTLRLGKFRIATPLTLLALALCLAGNAWLWTSPTMRSDDHRGAVAHIAANWRPGEAILVNAGWAYRAFSVYWPTQAVGPDAALPPPLAPNTRLTPNLQLNAQHTQETAATTVPILYTGSINAPQNLGWQDPDADFFTISDHATQQALADLAAQVPALWHYRIYDTVNDPQGIIRAWLEIHTTSTLDMPIAGRDFMRVARYATGTLHAPTPPDTSPTPSVELETAQLENGITVQWQPTAAPRRAGEITYLPVSYTKPDQATLETFAISLRLVDSQGRVQSQQDTPLVALPAGSDKQSITLALPVPVSLPPGDYTRQLIVYDRTTLTPIQPTAPKTASPTAPALNLGAQTILPPAQPPRVTSYLAQFDYIRLIALNLPTTVHAGQPLPGLRAIWLPQSSPYQDNYTFSLRLAPVAGSMNAEVGLNAPLGPPHYPSGLWKPLIPVRQDVAFATENAALLPGDYRVEVRVQRVSDAAIVAGRARWAIFAQEWIEIGRLTVEP